MTLQTAPAASDVPTFCKRYRISVTTAYKAARLGHLRISKLYGKALILPEDEAEFVAAVRGGKVETPPDVKEAETASKAPKQPPKRRLGSAGNARRSARSTRLVGAE
jgi:hypothetical protein